MAGDKFAAQVARFVTRSKRTATAVFRESTERLIDQAQTPVGAGGRMRVDTGFLRASGQASLSGLPTGPSRREEGNGDFNYSMVIAGAELGGTIWFGWTAEYARIREYHDGFMRGAAQNWQAIVTQVAREAKAR